MPTSREQRRTHAGDFVAELWEKAFAKQPVHMPTMLPKDFTESDMRNYNRLFGWLHKHNWTEVKEGLGEGPYTGSTYYAPGHVPAWATGEGELVSSGLRNWPHTHRHR